MCAFVARKLVVTMGPPLACGRQISSGFVHMKDLANLGHDGHLVRSVVLVVGPSNPLSALPRAPTRLFQQISMEQSLAPPPGRLSRDNSSNSIGEGSVRQLHDLNEIHLYEDDSDSDHEGDAAQRASSGSRRRLYLQTIAEANRSTELDQESKRTTPPDGEGGTEADTEPGATADATNGKARQAGEDGGSETKANGAPSPSPAATTTAAAHADATAATDGSGRDATAPTGGGAATTSGGVPTAPAPGPSSPPTPRKRLVGFGKLTRPKSRDSASGLHRRTGSGEKRSMRGPSPHTAPKTIGSKKFSQRQIDALHEMDREEVEAVAGAALLQFATTMGGVLVEATFRDDLHAATTRADVIGAYDRLFVRIRRHTAAAYHTTAKEAPEVRRRRASTVALGFTSSHAGRARSRPRSNSFRLQEPPEPDSEDEAATEGLFWTRKFAGGMVKDWHRRIAVRRLVPFSGPVSVA